MQDWQENQIDDEEQLDRLVDGELDDDARRVLLAALDTQPDGWRRCALAFLAAQTWGQTSQDLVVEGARAAGIRSRQTLEESRSPVQTLANSATKGPSSTSRNWVWGSFAVAASFALAFVLGLAAGEWFGSDSPDDRIVVAPQPPTAPLVTPAEMSAAPHVDWLDEGPQAAEGSMTLVVGRDNDGPGRTVRAPVLDAGPLESWLSWDTQSGLPRELVEHLEASGHRVQRHRRVAPVDLDDGRRMMVPVVDYEIVKVY
jgi:hypothetical protein